MKKIRNIALALLLSAQMILPTFAADFLPIQVFATDAIAGYPAMLRTSLIDADQNVRFVVEKPDGAVVQLPATADLTGVAKTDLFGHQTKVAGVYNVAVVYPGSPVSSPQSSFNVYADQVSTSQSSFKSTLAMAEAGKDVTFLVATLYDQYRNPVSDHRVNVISSRSEDKIEAIEGGVTDENGRASFKVTSQFPGISTFTAIDTTVNEVLDHREEVVFFAPTLTNVATSPFGASVLSANIGQGETEVLPGPVHEFEIQDVPSNVKVGELHSISIVAKDKDGNIAKNYTGTILFSVPDDENAVLPSNGEYTFKDTDQGQFTFDLALSFSQIGSQVIQVFDKNNFKIAGEFPVEVNPTQAINPGASSSISIKSPTDGAQLGSSLVVIAGQGKENINLKVFDNDIKIADTETDAEGFFSYDVSGLEPGTHTFYVMSEAGEVSKSVSILIDTIPPVLNSFTISPEGAVAPGEQMTITLESEPGIDSAKIRLQGIEENLEESVTEPGTYSVTVPAPTSDGQFPVDVILLDTLSNKAEFLNKGTISVQTPEPTLPPTVQGVEAVADDKIIQLAWNAIEDHERPIEKYRILYGTHFETLDLSIDTINSTPRWELRGLENDVQYFISVKAIDTQGLESEFQSVVIAATPVGPELEPIPEPEPVPELDPVPVPMPNVSSQLNALPFDGGVSLSWGPFPGVRAYYYQVLIGVQPGQYIDSITTADNRTALNVTDLINNVPYHFVVMALDINGRQISPFSQEVQAIPSGTGFRPSAPSPVQYDPNSVLAGGFDDNIQRDQLESVPRTDETGPETFWVMVGSILFATFFYSHKRNVLKKARI